MLMSVYDHAINKREEILKLIDKDTTEKIKRKVRDDWWNEFKEKNEFKGDDRLLAGIDSSWNLKPYHGFYLYIVDAISIMSDETILGKKDDINIESLAVEESGKIIYNPAIALESKGMEFEHELIKGSKESNKCDIILVDGSLQARMYDYRRKAMIEFYTYDRSVFRRDDIIFISKRSDSRNILNGNAADIYYFDHATTKSGYSSPYYDKKKDITIVYARFTDYTPCLKVEFGMNIDKDLIEDRLLSIKEECINGYPYVLYLAHERCKISNDDIRTIESILGLEIEIGGREVLEY
ncbi:MAG: DNA double-strand break repair nuclease NurA [Candidatus Nitrosocaldaceae archaeon]